MFVFDRGRETMVEFSLEGFAKLADKEIVLIREDGKVLEYYPGYTPIKKLKKFLPNVKSVEKIHVTIFGEAFGRQTIGRSLVLQTLHEVIDFLAEEKVHPAAFIAESDSLYIKSLDPDVLGKIIDCFFVEKL